MHQPIPSKRALLVTAISVSLCSLSSPTFAQQDTVEEIIVTGSYIRRSEGFTQASSVTQLTAEDLAAEGTMNMGEVMQNLPFVLGRESAITASIAQGGGTQSNNAYVDLRGLGARSTLTLVDGKRVANDNVMTMLPTIAIQRIDIVADGAAALYGSEAVAGVVNFVPYTSYDGLKIDTFAEQDSRGDYDEQSAQLLWGGDVGDVDVVLAGQFKENSRLGWGERPLQVQSGLMVSPAGPGNYLVPIRNAAGQYAGRAAPAPDPACAPVSQRQYTDADSVANPFGMRLGRNCFTDISDFQSYRQPSTSNSFFANASWEVSDELTLSLQGFTSLQNTTNYRPQYFPNSSRIGELPTFRGELPGNPFRARNARNQQLYGVDLNQDGIPDRGPVDRNRDGLLDYIVSGTTNNGVPLHEDVRPRTFAPLNATQLRPDGVSSTRQALQHLRDQNSRYSLQADFQVPGLEGWEGLAIYTTNTREGRGSTVFENSISAMIQGLNCDVVNDRDACYNPFFITDPANHTAKNVLEAIMAPGTSIRNDEVDTIDLVLNGEVGIELPGGQIAAAVGYQRREESYRDEPSTYAQAGDAWAGSYFPEPITSGERDIDAFFAELAVPLLPALELEMAIRREEFSSGHQSTDPKVGLTWQALDWLTLRATTGDAFIAPSLQDSLAPTVCSATPLSDRFTPYTGYTGSCFRGNPNLENESSTSRQLGLDLNFGDFDLSLTYNNTEFDNRIVNATGQQVLDTDFDAFKAWSGFTGSGVCSRTGGCSQPSLAELQAWLDSGLANLDIIRNPRTLRTIDRIDYVRAQNTESVEVTAWDIYANYNLGLGDWGDVRANLQATHVDEFLVQNAVGLPTRDGAGVTNLNTGAVPATPKWKALLRLGWTLGNHAVTGTVHHLSSMEYDGNQFVLVDNFPNTFRMDTTELHAWTDFDLAYSYRGLALFGGEMALTLGARNLFDRWAQRVPNLMGIIAEMQDPMGRTIYARMVFDF